MSSGTDTFGDVARLATALGLLGPDGEVSTDFFVDPAAAMRLTLRDPARRAALLEFLGDVVGDSAPSVTEAGAIWTPIFELSNHAHLYLVATTVADGVTIGIGARAETAGSPHAEGRMSVPIVLVPTAPDAALVFLPDSSSIDAVASISAEIDVASDTLGSVGVDAKVPLGSGATGDLAVSVKGLHVPGAPAPLDLTLDGAADVGPQLAQVVAALADAELAAAAAQITGDSAIVLGLIGLGPDAVVPLPVADVAVRGLPALRDWLGAVIGSDTALATWFAHFATLLGISAPSGSLSASVSLAAGIDLTAELVVGTDDSGGRTLAPTISLVAQAGGSDASFELAATLLRVAVGPHPSLTALPSLMATARYGALSGPSNILDVTEAGTVVRVGALRAGVGLSADRAPVFVLAALRVAVGPSGSPATHDVLDLTSPDALADVGAGALSSVASNLLAGLGPAATALSQLLGLTKPTGHSGSWPTLDAAALFANPAAAVLGFHKEVLALGASAYAELLGALASLLGQPAVASAAGSADDPFVVATLADVALALWSDGAMPPVLHVGMRYARTGQPVGGGNGPTPSLALLVDALALTLPDASSAPLDLHVLRSARVVAELQTPAGHAFEFALGAATVSVPEASFTFTWDAQSGAHTGVDLPGASVTVDATNHALALPTIDSGGHLALPPGLSDAVLEAVLGGLLAQAQTPWVTMLTTALGLGTTPSSTAAFDTLATDPRAWLALRLRELMTSPAARDALHALAAALAPLLTGPLTGGAPALVASPPVLHGAGTPSDPFTMPLQTGPAAFDVMLWLDPAGPPIPSAALGALLEPAALTAWLDHGGAALTSTDLAALLGAAGAAVPGLADLVAGRGALASGLDTLVARTTGGDGLLPGAAPAVPGATVVTLANIAHRALAGALDLGSIAGIPAGARVVYVTGPYVPPWPDSGVPTLDLTAAGLAATAFDTTAVAAGTGSWHVRLPFRGDCPGADADARASACAERLQRAVAAAATGGKTVVLVAHGPAAAGVARVVAAAGAPVVAMVLLGATAAALPLDVLDAPPAADALALARRLLPAPTSGESADLAFARAMVEQLGDLFDATRDPAVDFAVPAGAGAPTVPTWSVRGAIDGDAITKALGALVRAGLGAFAPGSGSPAPNPGNPGAPAPAAPTALRAAIGVHVALPASVTTGDPAGISLDVRARVDLPGLPLADGHPVVPAAVRVDVDVSRGNGWLVGGPQGAAPTPGQLRTPSLRRARLSVGADLGGSAAGARATITLFEATALGVARDAWVLGAGGEQPGPEARVLLGRLASAFAPIPVTGPITALTDLLRAAGLADPATASPGFGLAVDAIQQLLIDPASALRAALAAPAARAAAAGALRTLLGGSGTGGQFLVALGDALVTVDAAASPPTVTLATTANGITFGSGTAAPVLHGSVQADLHGGWLGRLALGSTAAAFGSPTLDVDFGSAAAIALTFAAAPTGVPARVPLFPMPSDASALAAAALETALANAVRALVAHVRTDVLDTAQRTAVDPVLQGLGLLAGTGSAAAIVAPFGLATDPLGWLHRAFSGSGFAPDKVATLIDSLRDALDLGAATHGVLPLTSRVVLSATPAVSGTAVQLSIGYHGTTGDLDVAADAGITVAPGTQPVPHLDATLGISGQHASLELALDGSALSAIVHTAASDIRLLSAGPGLGSLATAGAQQALPYVLDALVAHGPAPIPTVLAAARDALGLGASLTFSPSQLQTLAANPATELPRRLAAFGPGVLAKLAELVPPLPAGWSVTPGSNRLRIGTADEWVELRFGGTPQVLTVEASVTAALPGVTGASVTVDAVVDATGLRQLTASGQFDPAQAIDIGPLSIAPVVDVSVGPAVTPEVALGVVVAQGSTTRAALLAVTLDPLGASLRTRTGTTDDPNADPAVIVTHVLVPLVANAVLQESHVQTLLATHVGSATVSSLLDGVVLAGNDFDAALLALDPADLMKRLVRGLANLATAVPTLTPLPDLALSFSDGSHLGIGLSVTAGQRVDLIPGGDFKLAVEVDDAWVDPTLTPPGLSVMFVDAAAGTFVAPIITVDGVGLRLYRAGGPLLDTVLSIGSVALFALLRIDGSGITDGGFALQLADLALPIAAASGGSNGVAQGVLGNTKQAGSGGDGTPLKPSFSPELALQTRQGSTDVAWSLTAGPGNGPWMLHIGRSFGPLRVDDVGFGTDKSGTTVTGVRVLVSGGLSLVGLNLDVQDLSVGATWPSASHPQPLTDPASWSLDLGGLDVSYSGGGIQLAGGLRKRDNPSLPGNPPDYVGLLLAHIGPYGLTAFGGYGEFPAPDGSKYTSLFIFAAINAPIGGPPAFFVTGLGGGAGINRALVLPTSLDDFATFPMVAALDPHSTLADDPAHAMDLLSASFPPDRGMFWFAAGVSFTSFALIDVVAVVAVEVGDGFALTLLGLARAALPTTYFPLAQLELAMMARFSTKEGILEVRAQLTDNSYLLTRDCRLTGGFAYVSWFSPNPNAGQFVVTIGGYHPSFHRDDYPDVPRVGFRWDLLGCLTITGGSYFALTSEAIMAGTNFTAALTLGPLWASLTLGVDAIVFFDPFHFLVTGYASIAAGITIDIDLFFGHITITLSFHLGAQVTLEGPDFHGSATIDLDVTSATIAFGSTDDHSTPPLGWNDFAAKYLTAGNGKSVLSAAVRDGGITSGGGGAAPDGSQANPWLLLPEFGLSVTSTAAAATAAAATNVDGAVPLTGGPWIGAAYALTGTVAIAPMGVGGLQSRLGVSIVSGDTEPLDPPVFSDGSGSGIMVSLVTAPLPKGVWAPQLATGAIPSGDAIDAGTGLTVTVRALIEGSTPAIPYDQVDAGPRQPLPFANEAAVRTDLDPDASNAAGFDTGVTDATTVLRAAQGFLASGPFGNVASPMVVATFARDHIAPPRLALITENLAPVDGPPPVLEPIVPPVPPVIDTSIHPPVVTAFLAGGAIGVLRPITRSSIASTFAANVHAATAVPATPVPAPSPTPIGAPLRAPAPTLAAVRAALDPALGARLVLGAPNAVVTGGNLKTRSAGVAAADGGPVTRRAAAPGETHRRPGLPADAAAILQAHEQALVGGGTVLRPGDVLVTTLPNHERDFDPGVARPSIALAGDAAVRVVALSAVGEVLADTTARQIDVEVPARTARLVCWCVGGDGPPVAGLAGWAATDRLPYVGAGVTLGSNCAITGLTPPQRGLAHAQAAHHLVGVPAARASALRTLLPPGTTVMVVSLDTDDAAAASGLTLGIDGAQRATGADGSVTPPTVVTARGRTHLVYPLAVDPAEGFEPVVVTVGADTSWRCSGVAGAIVDAATVALQLAAHGPAALLAPMLRAPTGTSRVRFVTPAPTPGSPSHLQEVG